MSHFLLELFFPSFCLGCKKEGIYLCSDCKATLDISGYQYCLCSKNPLRLLPSPYQGTCSRCKNSALSGLYSALPYQERWLTRKLIHQYKYKPYLKALAKPLAEIITEHLLLINHQTWDNSIFVPVPMEAKKLRRRGYNQAELLAKELGQIIGVSVNSNVLTKIKPTPPQMELNKTEREQNLKGVFAIKNPAALAGKKIFLIDDVYTTGSTIKECARVLKDAGAKSVYGVVIARED